MGRLPPHASCGGFARQRRSPSVDCNGTLRRSRLDGARLPAQPGRARSRGTIPRERTAPPIRVWPRPVTATLGSVFECRAGHVGVWLSSARQALPRSIRLEQRPLFQPLALWPDCGHRSGTRAWGERCRGRALAPASRLRTRQRPNQRERPRRAPRLPARGARARRRAGRLRGALAMTAEELARAIAASGVRGTAQVAEAARAVAGWLARAPADEVAEGLAAAAEPAAALHQLARLLPAVEAPPAPGRVAPLLRLLGGSPALAAALVAEGAAWPALVAAVHEVPARGPDAQRAALAAAGAAGPLSRADLQAALRRHRRRELVRIGGRDLLGLASVEDTVRELSALAEGVLDAAVASVRARLAAEWGEALVPGEGRPEIGRAHV